MRLPRRALATALAAAMLTTACGGTSDGPGGGTVRLLVFGSPDEIGAYRTLVEAYKKAVPGGDVQLVEASDRKDLITRLSTSIAGGSPPDVFLMNYRFYGQFAAKNAVEPLDDRLAASKTIRPADYYPVAMEAFRWQGKQLCLPQNISSLAVYYNKDLFAKYGVPEPKPGWTWNDMLATAGALTRDAKGAQVRSTESEGAARKPAVYGLGVEPQMIRVAPFVWSNDGTFLDNEQRPTRIAMEGPQAREVLKNLVELRTVYGVVPTDEEVEAEDDESRFTNGRLAMLMSSRRVTTTFRTIKGFKWDVAALPTYGKPANVLHSDAYCMTSGSKNKDATWRFMEYAFSADGQRIMAATGRTVPSHVGASKSTEFLDPAKSPQHAQVFLDSIAHVRQLPTVSTWPEIEDITGGILENALYRGDRLDDVIRELDAKTRPLFARGSAP